MQFNNANRARIKEENPDASFAEIAKMVSEAWKGLGTDEKKKYEDMAAKDKQRYADEMKDYTPPPGDGTDAKGKAEKGKGKACASELRSLFHIASSLFHLLQGKRRTPMHPKSQ